MVHLEISNKCGSTWAECNGGAFICRTKDGDVVLKNNGKGMPYIDLREFETKAVLFFAPEAALSFVQTVRREHGRIHRV